MSAEAEFELSCFSLTYKKEGNAKGAYKIANSSVYCQFALHCLANMVGFIVPVYEGTTFHIVMESWMMINECTFALLH